MKGSPHLYHVFYLVASHKSMTSAAKELYISQPAISKAMKTLETQLTTQLFIRKSTGVILTDDGQLLYAHVSKAMKALESGEKKLQEKRTSHKTTIKIGVSTTMCKFFLLKHLQDFQGLYPNLSVQIINNSTKQTLKSLRIGSIDIGINCFPSEADDLEMIKLFDIHDIFVAHKDYIHGNLQHPIDLETLATHPLFLLHEDSIARESMNTYFRANGIELKPHMETENMDFIIECAKSGAGIACVIREFVKEELRLGTFIQIPIEFPPPTREAGIIYSKYHDFESHVACLVHYLESKIV